MSAIRDYIVQKTAADAVRRSLVAFGQEEIEFYRGKGVIEGLRKINGIS
jgi:hypothetical protein